MWLRRAFIAFCVLVLMLTAALLFSFWWESGTHLGRLASDRAGTSRSWAANQFSHLRQDEAGSRDALHFAAMPAMAMSGNFTVSLWKRRPGDRQVSGILVQTPFLRPAIVTGFHMPATVYDDLTHKIDRLMDWYPGAIENCYDGTAIAFERVRGLLMTSGIGRCDNTHAAVSRIMLERIRPFVGVRLPLDNEGWMLRAQAGDRDCSTGRAEVTC